MSSLEEIRKRKLQQMMAAQNENTQQQAQLQEQVAQLEAAVKQHMTKEAVLRYGSIKAAHPEKAVQSLVVLSQLLQSGRLEKIDDATFKKILEQMAPKKREIKITK